MSLDGKLLNVDHCHSTGVVRGLLCLKCNTSLGKLKENLHTITAMFDYVEKWNRISGAISNRR